jgi:hypothetical protein
MSQERERLPNCRAAETLQFDHGGFRYVASIGRFVDEWLQRPENVLAGFVRWSDYRPAQKPTFLQTEHAKTGAKIWHPLEDDEGNRLYRKQRRSWCKCRVVGRR